MKQDSWRHEDFEVFLWDKLDTILIFDTATYTIQANLFKKLAFFTEKLGYAEKIHPDEKLEDKHGYRAHNYSAADLARFFNLSERSSLNAYELWLKEILIVNNILIHLEGTLYPGRGGVISICRQTQARLRQHLFVHELLHAVFYCLPSYQEGVYQVWKSLSNLEKEFWILFLWGNGYNTQNPDIVINEFHAYLLQQYKKNISWLLFNRGVRDITEAFPARKKFVDQFADECKKCLDRAAVLVEDQLIIASSEAGFDFPAYLDSMKPY